MRDFMIKNIAGTGIIEVNEHLEIEYIDPVLKYYFTEPEQWTGKKVTDIPELKKYNLNDFIQKLSSGQHVKKKIHLSAGKEQKEILIEGEPLIKRPGIYKRAAILIQDITPLIKKWAVLNLSMENFKNITASIPTGIIVTDESGWILFSNPVAGNILESVFKRKRKIPATFSISEGTTREISYTTSENITFHFEVTLTKTNWFGKPAFLYVLHDITSLKKSENQNLILLSAIRFSINGIAIINHDMVIDWINPAFTRITGWSMEEAVGAKITTLVNKDGELSPSFTESIRETIDNTKHFRTEIRRPKKNGTYFYCELNITPFFDHVNNKKRYVFVFNDLTKRKEKEKIILILNKVFESLQKASSIEESFMIFRKEMLKNQLHTVIYLFDNNKKSLIPQYSSFDTKTLERFTAMTGVVFNTLKIPVSANKKYERIISKKETVFSNDVSKDLSILTPQTSQKQIKALIQSLGIQHSISAPIINRNGEVTAIFQLFSDLLTGSNVPEVTAFANHLSFFFQKIQLLDEVRLNYNKLQKNYVKLQANRKKYKDFFDHDLTGDYIATPEGKFLDCNQAFVDMLGFSSKKEALRSKPQDMYADPAARERFLNILRKKGKVVNYEETLVRKDGKKIFVLLNAYGVFNEEGHLVQIVGYIFDITQRKQYEAELIQEKEKAEEGNRLKTAFLSNMSHEIRTPLNAIMGFAELLNDPGISQDEINNYVGIIKSSGRHLSHILDEILYISRIEANEIIIHKEPFDVHSLLKELLLIYEKNPLTLKKRLSIKAVNHLDTPYMIKSDKERLREILQNLLNNAIKFTEEGSIYFGYKEKSAYQLEFYVKDTGMGIAKKDLSRIFNRFQQGDNSLTRLHEGVGLGLSISRDLVKLLGGNLHVVSKPGEGSVFSFTIPKK